MEQLATERLTIALIHTLTLTLTPTLTPTPSLTLTRTPSLTLTLTLTLASMNFSVWDSAGRGAQPLRNDSQAAF